MSNTPAPSHFLQKILKKDLASGWHSKIVTRFPPEPNGYLHIGHAKSICLNFGLAEEFGGECNLRFDDTNPEKESQEYIDSIKSDVKWLGFQWAGDVHYSSDYFEKLHDYAIHLINNGDAYVCDLSADEDREYRGSLTEPGKNSPYRERSAEENLTLFAKMRAGDFDEGSCVLRAKIDMAAPNINLRDPIIYRIRKVPHHQTGDTWCIYPTYDFTHGQSDAEELVTHSICTLEFEDHRPLYDWFLAHLPVPAKPRQYEFSRLNLNYTVTSKRKLKQLVDEQHVSGWDDPRMPTISGLRRRGYTPLSIRNFCERIGVTRKDGVVDVSMLEHAIREDLDANASRAMCVLNPVKVVLENYPEDQVEMLTGSNHPQDESFGTREIPFSREIYVEQSDYKENANRKFFRLTEGREVRLRHAYYITCKEAIKDADGNVVELRCPYDPESRGGTEDGRKVKGTIHWISAAHAEPVEVRLYDRLFNHPKPASVENFLETINPDSLEIIDNALLEPGIVSQDSDVAYQFERNAYFKRDKTYETDKPIFNQVVTMRDSWAKLEQQG